MRAFRTLTSSVNRQDPADNKRPACKCILSLSSFDESWQSAHSGWSLDSTSKRNSRLLDDKIYKEIKRVPKTNENACVWLILLVHSKQLTRECGWNLWLGQLI